jgi:hypothetical protein
MEWERERPSSFARALFLSNAFRRRDARLQSRSFVRRNQSPNDPAHLATGLLTHKPSRNRRFIVAARTGVEPVYQP